jgi:hypothetical protein
VSLLPDYGTVSAEHQCPLRVCDIPVTSFVLSELRKILLAVLAADFRNANVGFFGVDGKLTLRM